MRPASGSCVGIVLSRYAILIPHSPTARPARSRRTHVAEDHWLDRLVAPGHRLAALRLPGGAQYRAFGPYEDVKKEQ